VNLWEKSPGSGRVNLDLARDSVQLGDDDQAIRYFRAAVLGSWEGDPWRQRRDVRLELCQFLIANGRVNDAQAEIAGLAADTPAEDGILHEEIGQLFMKAGEPSRALAEFEAALRTNPSQSQWLADAARAAFDAGDYLKAESYYSKADRENPSPEISSSLTLVQDILGNDPFLAGLSEEEQTRRTRCDIRQAIQRLRQCSAASAPGSAAKQLPASLQLLELEAQDLEKPANLRSLAKSPEARNQAMQLVFRIENASSQTCGPATGVDQALILIGKRHEGTNP
jgi:tetratricopeptide (TPR) repeat protein